MHIIKTHKLLCAVSGGIDSMVLLDLFIKEQFNVEVVHINYKLRAEDSLKDQILVEEICRKNNIKSHILRLDKPENVNVQEWARDQRFLLFENLKMKFDFDFVALAHHDEDQLETILLSIFKGYALQTISSQRDFIIRPLIDVDKKLINNYASANGIEYRLDKSNLSSSYDRNFLRNEIIPSLKNRVPNFKTRILKFAERQKNDRVLLEKLIEQNIKKWISEESNNIGNIYYQKINLQILETKNGKDVLVQYLKMKFKFSSEQISNLLDSNKPEAEIHSDNFIAQKNRSYLYLVTMEGDKNNKKNQEETIQFSELPYRNHKLYLNKNDASGVDGINTKLRVDIGKLQFPLILRKGHSSEDFHAFGLKGAKTELGKFMKKNGKPGHFRSLDYILIDAIGHIIVPGLEIDYRLSVDNNTKSCLIIEFEDKTYPIIAQSYQD